jgi:hypothetical protein
MVNTPSALLDNMSAEKVCNMPCAEAEETQENGAAMSDDSAVFEAFWSIAGNSMCCESTELKHQQNDKKLCAFLGFSACRQAHKLLTSVPFSQMSRF